jgi:hypothetical protein
MGAAASSLFTRVANAVERSVATALSIFLNDETFFADTLVVCTLVAN